MCGLQGLVQVVVEATPIRLDSNVDGAPPMITTDVCGRTFDGYPCIRLPHKGVHLINQHGVDRIIASAIANDPYERGHADVSVSELVTPPQAQWLIQEHGDNLYEDVSERLWSLLGSAVHVILAQAAPEDAIVEQRFYREVDGVLVGGKPDIYEDGHLRDYKVTSTWSFILPGKGEWESAENIYAVLLRDAGHPVEHISISGILRDHLKGKQYEEGYPPIPYAEKSVRVWAPEEAERYLAERVKLHQRAREGVYDPCTPEERWEKPTTFAVRKKDVQKARRVLPSMEEAEAWIENNSKELERRFLTVEERVGGSIRCQSYCAARRVCGQAAELGVEIQ